MMNAQRKWISCGFFLLILVDALRNAPKFRPVLKLGEAVSNTQEDFLESYWRAKERFVYSETGYKLNFNKFEREYVELGQSFDSTANAGVHTNMYGIYGHENINDLVEDSVNEVTENKVMQGRDEKVATHNSYSVFNRENWKEVNGNYILRPHTQDDNPPVGVIHFLGGAFVGAIPHLAYKNLLESLGNAGYLIVATPYRLEFDYAKTCDSILEKFDSVAVELANEYGPLPVVGIGHSCGALLQSLITSLFPSVPRAANVLISFNNKPAREAIPALEELIVPLSYVLNNNPNSASPFLNDDILDFNEVMRTMESTFDELISRSPLVPKFVGNDLIPMFRDSVRVVDQIPDILKMIGEGKIEFIPSPGDAKEVCRRMYRARSTLLLKFENDSLDESEEIEDVLKEANTIMRMKRPMIEMDVEMKYLDGTHLTPLTQNLFRDVPNRFRIPFLNGLANSLLKDHFVENLPLDVDNTKNAIIDWLDVKLGRYSGLHKTASTLDSN